MNKFFLKLYCKNDTFHECLYYDGIISIYLDGSFQQYMIPTLNAVPNLVNKRGIAKRHTSSFK